MRQSSSRLFPPPLIPVLDGRALDLAKIFAAVCMVIDHANCIWYHYTVTALLIIGRATFPLFCYATAISMRKADAAGARRYILRLLLLALVSEPVSILTRNEGSVNVLFTLALGALFISVMPRLKDWQVAACQVLGALTALLSNTMEFGIAGVMLPSAILLVMNGRLAFLPSLLLLLAVINSPDLIRVLHIVSPGRMLLNMLTFAAPAALLPWLALAVLRLSDVTGARLLPRYFLHAFYPLHMLALWVLKLILFRG